jgi:hypothetical protein
MCIPSKQLQAQLQTRNSADIDVGQTQHKIKCKLQENNNAEKQTNKRR